LICYSLARISPAISNGDSTGVRPKGIDASLAAEPLGGRAGASFGRTNSSSTYARAEQSRQDRDKSSQAFYSENAPAYQALFEVRMLFRVQFRSMALLLQRMNRTITALEPTMGCRARYMVNPMCLHACGNSLPVVLLLYNFNFTGSRRFPPLFQPSP